MVLFHQLKSWYGFTNQNHSSVLPIEIRGSVLQIEIRGLVLQIEISGLVLPSDHVPFIILLQSDLLNVNLLRISFLLK